MVLLTLIMVPFQSDKHSYNWCTLVFISNLLIKLVTCLLNCIQILIMVWTKPKKKKKKNNRTHKKKNKTRNITPPQMFFSKSSYFQIVFLCGLCNKIIIVFSRSQYENNGPQKPISTSAKGLGRYWFLWFFNLHIDFYKRL